MQVSLFKRKVPYVNADGEQKTATNFFVSCGDVLVPVEVKYFENKETHRDDRYLERKTLLSAFADTLPEREKNNVAAVSVPQSTSSTIENGNEKNGQAIKNAARRNETLENVPF